MNRFMSRKYRKEAWRKAQRKIVKVGAEGYFDLTRLNNTKRVTKGIVGQVADRLDRMLEAIIL